MLIRILVLLVLYTGLVNSLLASETLNIQSGTGESQAVILMYHHFGVDKHPSTNIRLEQFEAHLDHLAQAGYQVWPLTRVIEYIQNKKPFPSRVVVITIDDAYQSVYTEAYPRLKNRGWPFTVFVSTDGVDSRYRSYMSWQQMREMQKHGVTFANHSASHDYLIKLKQNENQTQWKTRITNDINRAQARLKTELGNAPMLFAYPYGEYNTTLANTIAEMGYVAFGQHSGPAGPDDDLRALPRFPMAEKFAALPDFKQKIASLAFPIKKLSPWEPLINPANNPPKLEITLGNSDDVRLNQLTCFVSGQGRVEIKWINRQKQNFSVQATRPLSAGRNRYNCTAPSSQKGRFYWYSHLWINQKASEKGMK